MTDPLPPSARLSLTALRARVRAIERPQAETCATVPLGVTEIDSALPWRGLPCGRLHQITGGEDGFRGPSVAFAARLAGRCVARVRQGGDVLWVVARSTADDTLYGPGLTAWGLTSDRLVVARAKDPDGVLWCLEEGLRCPALAAVIGHVRSLDPSTGRRLQLAAERGGVLGLLLPSGQGAGWQTEHGPGTMAATGATTRWHVTAAPAAEAPWAPSGLGRPRWTVRLDRCQGSPPRTWLVETDDASGDLSVVSECLDRPADAAGDPFRRLA